MECEQRCSLECEFRLLKRIEDAIRDYHDEVDFSGATKRVAATRFVAAHELGLLSNGQVEDVDGESSDGTAVVR